jgi:hypothetical protein
MDICLSTEGVGIVGNHFTTNSTNPMEVNSTVVSVMPNGCYNFSRHNLLIMLSATSVSSGNEYIFAEIFII